MDTETQSSPDVAHAIGGFQAHAPARWKRWAKWGVLALIVVALGSMFFGRGGAKETKYTMQDVATSDLTVTITATGNLEPRNQVDIGSELSGTVRSVFVDVNDQVKVGQVLAVLDTSRLQAQVLQAQSSLASAEARVVQGEASEKEARANYARLQKVRELSGNRLPSQQDLDVAEAAVARAQGEAAAARASVAQSRANLEAVRTDLGKAEVRSPINGVVLVRSVEPGQTVAATMTAPVLFTLAEDLKKMELHVSVDEADVGSVEVGQKATFTVDAFANRRFQAHITQVHLASNNTQKSSTNATSTTSTGVVTYETVLEVDNSEQLLRPGMTATAEIVTTSIENALVVPNAALRFNPPGEQLFPGAPGAGQQGGGAFQVLMPQINNNRNRFNNLGGQQGGRRIGRAWVLENGKPELVIFRPGATDGRVTQVLPLDAMPNNFARANDAMAARFQKAMERKLEPGTKVIVDAETPKS